MREYDFRKIRRMLGANDNTGAALLLILVVIAGALASLESYTSARHVEEEQTLPRRIVTLGQTATQCQLHSFQSGLQVVGCSEGTRSEQRGGGLFMRPPSRP